MLPPYGGKCILHILLTSCIIRSVHSCLATGQTKAILVPSSRSTSTTSTSTTTTTSPQTTTSPETTTTSTPLMTTTTSSTTTTTTTTTSTTTTTTRLECMAGWTFFSFTNKCYKLFTTPVLQSQAETICVNNGGHLVSLHSAVEDTFVRDVIVGFNAYYWIGLFAPAGCCAPFAACCIYNWFDGTPFDYMGWVTGHPFGSLGSCVYVVNVANHTTVGWDSNLAYEPNGACPATPCPSCTLTLEFVCKSDLISVG